MSMKSYFAATLFASVLRLSSAALAPYAVFDYCKPTSSCWPSSAEWSSFNASLNGGLVAVTPWAAPCYNGTGLFDTAKCAAIGLQYQDGTARSNQIGATEELNWETCGDAQCLWPPVPGKTCQLGRLSKYAVNVTSADQVVTAVKWAYAHNIQISVKNTGHEYLGRGTNPDSLNIVTHNLKSMQYNANYSPASCSAGGTYDAVILGAGAQAADVYKFASDNGRAITLGACPTVGVAGGFAQGGGHGPLGPSYGLAVDNILQFTVVSYKGETLIANECNNADLFYAMRGGGGGVWGVVLETVYKVHPDSPWQTYAFLATNMVVAGLTGADAVMADFVSALARVTPIVAANNGSFYAFIQPPAVAGQAATYNVGALFPTSDGAHVKSIMSNFTNHFTGNLKYTVVAGGLIQSQPNFLAMYNSLPGPGASLFTPVGLGEVIASRFVPRSLFNSDASIASVSNAIVKGKNINMATYPSTYSVQIYATGPFNQPDNSKTGVNPAWRDELWEVLFWTQYQQGASMAQRSKMKTQTHLAADPLRQLTPGGGTYYSESDVLEDDWQGAFFGSNYAKLLSIKQKYDPQNYWNVWKGVGWTGPDNSTYRCYNSA